ncbi:hypothetical protein [Nocardioides sp. AX2bis]|uniref:hypothetical protein n=1 Tax=Nocardioides sp. AX2bis TaxID=2653157 RepID=UPI0012EF55A0|nr:hypothetical protein [Nocardioides sp. AX2bis]VXB59366.1 hypothetical protein NOCARDAX2BIS_250008 [Nocardioides sp. AX2bis]
MTDGRRLAHSGFTLTRDYPAPAEHVRIVSTYDMWLDGTHLSTSVTSYGLVPLDRGTRLVHTEHGVFLDQFWADGPNRETGSRGNLELLAAHLLT